MNLHDTILAADDLPREKIEVPEWPGVELYVRTMSGVELARLQDVYANAKSSLADKTATLAVLTLCDAAGTRIFSDEDTAAVAGKSGKALQRVAEVAHRLNALTEAEAKDIEKNSVAAPSGGSG